MPLQIQLEEIPHRVSHLCETPAALLAFINERQQWFRSSVGIALEGHKGGTCFCAQAVCGNDLYVVADASADPLFMNEPLVREAGVRFYAGMPLVSRSGFPLGTLAVLDHTPRTLSEVQAEVIRMYAARVMMELEMQRQSLRLDTLQEELRCQEDILNERDRHLGTVQRLNCMGSWEIGMRDRQLRCSDEMYRIFGIERGSSGDDINSFMQLIHAEDRQNVVIAQERALRGNAPLDTEFRVVRPDGEVRFVHMRAEMGTNSSCEESLSGTVQDITAKRQVAEHLRLLETSVAHLNDMVMITDAVADKPGPHIVFVNSAFERHTGYSLEEVKGRSPRFLQGPKSDRKQLDRLREAMKMQQWIRIEVINYKKSGEEFWGEIDIVPVLDKRGRATHFVAVQRDITERKHRDLELDKTTRALHMLKRCNEALMRAEDQRELLVQICELAVEGDGYQFAWVGLVRDDDRKTVQPVAHAGLLHDSARAAATQISWSPTSAYGRGPVGRVVWEGKPVLVEDLSQDPSMEPWQSGSTPKASEA